ncbi:FAD-binding oxidoreductase [Candidatus Thorarchaeota archaeon]|nr:MAG: FAD-binding oxidoreductase [Candidatus Thorarchaeota archaeon]
MNIVSELVELLGAHSVSSDPAERYIYSYDMTENKARKPLAVVMPSTTDQVRKIVELANQQKIPLVPFITGQNVGGLTIPEVDNSVIVDLKKMKRIIEVDEEAMYTLVEPGVTFGHLRRHLEINHPNLRYTYPLAPPFTSIMANVLLQGLCDLSTKHGAMGDFINGLEVVLPTGELVRVGSGVSGTKNWFSRYPLPDLVGLFSGWQGMTGIVTKIAVKLWPKPPITRYAALFTFGEIETTELLKELTRTGVLDDADCMSLSLVKMLLGVEYPVDVFDGEPDYATLLAFSGNSEIDVSDKIGTARNIVDKHTERESRHLFVSWDTIEKLVGSQAREWVDFPSDAFKILAEFDGLTWVGTYIHPRNWGAGLLKGREIVARHGFELMAFLKPMDGMHYGEFKFIIRFSKETETMKRVRSCNEALLELALSLGAIPYKTPVWAAEKLHSHIDPEFVKLVRRIKETLDPNNIMNPGRWAL